MFLDVARRRLSLDPRDPAFYHDPYPAYAQVRAACPRVHWEELGLRCRFGWPDVNAVLRDRRFGRQVLHVATRAELGWPEPAPHLAAFDAFERHSLLELEPPAHTRLRALVAPAFVSRQVDGLRAQVRARAHALIDRMRDRGHGDLIADFAAQVPGPVIAGFLGVPDALAPQFIAWSHDMVAMYQVRRDRALEDRAEAATRAFDAYMRALIAERRRTPGDDVVSTLLAARDARGAPLSEDALVTTAILLFNAGHEATVHAFGNGLAAFLRQVPHPAAAFAGNPVAHVEEMLRLEPPLHLFTRYALEDLELDGERFARGERIGLVLGAANRDPARFPDPDRFDAARAPGTHVAFGAGIHACLGAPLARLELQEALGALLARLPTLRLDGEPVVSDTWHFRSLASLPVRW